MNGPTRETALTVAPYLLWMGLMVLLPGNATSYAIRTGLVALALLAYLFVRTRGSASLPRQARWGSALWAGLLVGLLVLVLWIAPDNWAWYRRLFVIGGGGVTHADESGTTLRVIRLLGSAFVIAPAEELFFRSFLYRRLQSPRWSSVPHANFDLSAFLWTVGLFAVEHNRWLAGILAGALYTLVYMRRGLGAAVIAHVVTNLLLGLYVLCFDAWTFW